MKPDENKPWRPGWAVAPGEVLQELLDERGMSQAELSRRTNRPTKTINEIVRGKAAITADTAYQLELALGVDMQVWTNLEARFREHQALQRWSEELSENTAWIRRFPTKEMAQVRTHRTGRWKNLARSNRYSDSLA